MNIKSVNVADLIPYENNPRKNDGAVEAVAASIKEFGFKIPVVIDKNNVIIAGHTRLKAAQALGLESVPCIVADDLNDDQIRAFRLADNKTAEIAEWDFTALERELNNIEIDMSPFGFSEDEQEPDDQPERADLSSTLKGVFQIIIECENEDQQEKTYNELTDLGYICRVLTL